MFAVSVFSFVGQLYVLPPDFIKECRTISLKFMHGPRFWIHGVGGHAFFRAGEEVGFPAVPKCVESTGYQMLYNATIKHVPDFATKLLVLEDTWKSGSLNCAAALHAINNSPYTHCRIVCTIADRVSLPQKLQAAPDNLHLNCIIYDAFQPQPRAQAQAQRQPQPHPQPHSHSHSHTASYSHNPQACKGKPPCPCMPGGVA